jgi:hypothetical protein
MATISIDEFADRLYAAAGGKMRDRLQQEMAALALNAEGNAKVNATNGPRVRSGMLRRSIAGTVRGTGEALELRLSAGGRTGGGNVDVVIHNYAPGTQAKAEVREDGNGGKSIEIIVDELVSKNLARHGSASQQTLRRQYAVRPTLAGR